MKKMIFPRISLLKVLFLVIGAMLIVTSCNFFTTPKEKKTYTKVIYEPVYMEMSEIRSAVVVLPPKEIKEAGKIYAMGDRIYINEVDEGIHVIDNTDPTTPNAVAFINIPGNIDLAIKGTTLYADSYSDLIALNIANIDDVEEVARLEDVLESRYPVIDGRIQIGSDSVGVEEIPVEEPSRDGWFTSLDASPAMNMEMAGSPRAQTGTGGSMARFAIISNYLYIVTNREMKLIDISQPHNPATWTNINIGWGIETIFPYEDKLFIGSMSALYIYDNSDPSNPVQLARFDHSVSCDPVVVHKDRAYVTLRSGSMCFGGEDVLEIIDISNIESPELIKRYSMYSPHGLGVDDSVLFICDGSAGLKIYNASDDENIDLIHWEKNINTYDVIPWNKVALVISPQGLYQFDYSDLENITLLSFFGLPERN